MRTTIFLLSSVAILLSCTQQSSNPTNNNPDGTTVSVRANTEWTNTGVSVSSGQSVTITCSGTWRTGTWTSTPGTYTAAGAAGTAGGHPGMSMYPSMCMIGKIGSSMFYVGTGITITAQTSGTLYLGPNDGPTSDCWADNDGAITATITIN